MNWLRDWWDRMQWRPDAADTRAKDQKVELLRRQAIAARQAHERAAVVVEGQIEVMRASLKAVAEYRAAEQARLSRR